MRNGDPALKPAEGFLMTPRKPLDYEALVKGILAHIPEGVTLAEAPDTYIFAVSAFGGEVTGRSTEELVGATADRHPDQWDIFHLDRKTRARPDELPLTRAAQHGEVSVNEEWLLKRADGSFAHIVCNAGPIPDEIGERKWAVIAWRDITEYREMEAKLEAERNQTVALKEALVAEAHHRVKNHLTMMQSFLHLEAGSVADPDAKTAFLRVSNRLRTLSALYDELTVDMGARVEMDAYLSSVARNLVESLSTPHEPLKIHCETTLGPLASDLASTLALIVSELVTNACKHGRSSDGVCEVGITGRITEGEVLLTVCDNGPGVDVSRLEVSTGLSLVRGLVRQLRGEIAFSNNNGLTAEATVPLSPPAV